MSNFEKVDSSYLQDGKIVNADFFFSCLVFLKLVDCLCSHNLHVHLFQHPKIGGPGLVGSCEFPDGYVE